MIIGYIASSILLGHIKESFIIVKPQIVIWNGHLMESYRFGILEETIGSPNVLNAK